MHYLLRDSRETTSPLPPSRHQKVHHMCKDPASYDLVYSPNIMDLDKWWETITQNTSRFLPYIRKKYIAIASSINLSVELEFNVPTMGPHALYMQFLQTSTPSFLLLFVVVVYWYRYTRVPPWSFLHFAGIGFNPYEFVGQHPFVSPSNFVCSALPMQCNVFISCTPTIGQPHNMHFLPHPRCWIATPYSEVQCTWTQVRNNHLAQKLFFIFIFF